MRIFTTLLLLVLLSCSGPNGQPATSEEPDLATEILGTWEIMEMQVHAPSYLGEDTTVVQDIKEADWGQIYGVKPARTTYINDGKLRREFSFINGLPGDVTHGLWSVVGDSLRQIEPSITFFYKPLLSGGQLELTGKIDWDRDGQRDDDYRALFRLVGTTQ